MHSIKTKEGTNCRPADTAVHIIAVVTTVHTAHRIIPAAAGAVRRAIAALRILLRAAATGVIRRCAGHVLHSPTDGMPQSMVRSAISIALHTIMITIRRAGRQRMGVTLRKAITTRTAGITTI